MGIADDIQTGLTVAQGNISSTFTNITSNIGDINVAGVVPVNQKFRTLSVGMTRLSLYQLSIRSPTSLLPIPTNSYTFPLSPQMLRKEYMAYNVRNDVQGPASSMGVSRQMDQFGMSPPTIIIEGSTGWKLHSTDGYIWNGVTSVQKLENILKSFATLNQAQMQAGTTNFVTLEFYDFFKGEYWEVVPVGVQGIRQSSQSPLSSFYSFRFDAIRPVSQAILAAADNIASALFGAGGVAAISTASSFVGGILSNY